MNSLETKQPDIIISKQGRQLETTAKIFRRMKLGGFKEANFKGEGSKLSFKKFNDRDCYQESGYQFRGASAVNQIRRMLFEETDDGLLRGDALLIGSDYATAIDLMQNDGRPTPELLSALGSNNPDLNPATYEVLAGPRNQITRVLDTQLSNCRLAPLCKDIGVQSLTDFQDKKILTMFPEMVKLWCEINGIESPQIEFLEKGIDTEAAYYSNVIGIDVVESGKTARANGLTVLDQDIEGIPSVIPSVTLGLYARQFDGAVLQPVIYFKRQMERALNGMDQAELKFNVPDGLSFESDMAPVIADYLGSKWDVERVKRATVSPLANGGKAVELWVPKAAVKTDPTGNIFDKLEGAGARKVGSNELDLMGN